MPALRRCASFLFIFLVLQACKTRKQIPAEGRHVQDLRYAPNQTILISAHRGGKAYPGYPENCLETMQYLRPQIPDLICEVDVAQTRDSVLVLMHDRTLDRTTTGQGNITDTWFADLQKLFLEDAQGIPSSYRVPTLDEALQWARKSQTILMLDIKRSVDPLRLLEFVELRQALEFCVLITYSLETAQALYQVNPKVMLSVSIRSLKEYKRAAASGVPFANMVAFTGTRAPDPALLAMLHEQKVRCILGTLGNLDQQAAARSDSLYLTWQSQGVDIFATDRPLEAWTILRP